MLTSITITAWHTDHRRVQHTCLAYLSFQQLAMQTQGRSTETGLFTQTPGYLHWHITLQLISCCFGCLYCMYVSLCACVYVNNTQMVCRKGSCTIPAIVLFVCQRVRVKCDGRCSLRLAQSQACLHSQHTLLQTRTHTHTRALYKSPYFRTINSLCSTQK